MQRFRDRGGSQLNIPNGKWLTGSFNLTSDFTLFLQQGAVILASQVPNIIVLTFFLFLFLFHIFSYMFVLKEVTASNFYRSDFFYYNRSDSDKLEVD